VSSMNPRRICFFTGKRGGFTHFVPLLERIGADPALEYSVVACDMHLMQLFGETIGEVEDWSRNVYTLETALGSDSRRARAKSVGLVVLGAAELLEQLKPELVLVLGDRGEALGMTIAAVELNIPVAHLFGGDVCQGGVDEPVRHAITKLASVHLASNRQSADRIVRMGEEPWRVHTVGAPALDLIARKQYTPAVEICRRFQLDPDKPILVLLQHSVSWQVEEAGAQIRETLRALDELEYQTVAIYPCSDPGYQAVIAGLEERRARPWMRLQPHVPFADFWGLLSVAGAFVGNSSAGVIETPSFGLPFVNVGIRQRDRLRADNVIDAPHEKDAIVRAIRTALFDDGVRERARRCESPYGDGHAAGRIVEILKSVTLGDRLIQKRLAY